MKKVLTLLWALIALMSSAQIIPTIPANLVINPGLEIGSAVTGHSQISNATGWSGGTLMSTDLFEVGGPCIPRIGGGNLSYSIPSNKWHSNLPALNGNRYCGGSGITLPSSSLIAEQSIASLSKNIMACSEYEVTFMHSPINSFNDCAPPNSFAVNFSKNPEMWVFLVSGTTEFIIGKIPLMPVSGVWSTYSFKFTLSELEALPNFNKIGFVTASTTGITTYFLDNVSVVNTQMGLCDLEFGACISGADTFCQNEEKLFDMNCSDDFDSFSWEVKTDLLGGTTVLGPITGTEKGIINLEQLQNNSNDYKCYWLFLTIKKNCCGRELISKAAKRICIAPNFSCPEDKLLKVCLGGCVQIGYDDTQNGTFYWTDLGQSSSSGVRSVCPQATTEYTLVYTNSFNCQCTTRYKVEVEDLDVQFVSETKRICVGESYCPSLEGLNVFNIDFANSIEFNFGNGDIQTDIFPKVTPPFVGLSPEQKLQNVLSRCSTYPKVGVYEVVITVDFGPCGKKTFRNTVIVTDKIETYCTVYIADSDLDGYSGTINLNDFFAEFNTNSDCCENSGGVWESLGNILPNDVPVSTLKSFASLQKYVYANSDSCRVCVLKIVNAKSLTDGAGMTITIVPNPSKGKFTIAMPKYLEFSVNPDISILVLNSSGKIVYRGNQFDSNNSLTIDLTSYPNGVYNLKLISGDINQSSQIIKY